MGTQYSLRKKINYFQTIFKNMKIKGISLDEKKVIAQFCIIHASTPRKAKELIKMFEDAGEIKKIGSEIVSPELFEEKTSNKSTYQKSIHDGA
jgi:hypothetical protein